MKDIQITLTKEEQDHFLNPINTRTNFLKSIIKNKIKKAQENYHKPKFKVGDLIQFNTKNITYIYSVKSIDIEKNNYRLTYINGTSVIDFDIDAVDTYYTLFKKEEYDLKPIVQELTKLLANTNIDVNKLIERLDKADKDITNLIESVKLLKSICHILNDEILKIKQNSIKPFAPL